MAFSEISSNIIYFSNKERNFLLRKSIWDKSIPLNTFDSKQKLLFKLKLFKDIKVINKQLIDICCIDIRLKTTAVKRKYYLVCCLNI